MTDRARKSYIYAGVAVFFWATVPTVFKIGLGELEVIPFLALSTFTSAALLFMLLLFEKKVMLLGKMTAKEILTSALLGMLNPLIYYILLLKAYKLLPGQVAQPLNMIWPIILVFLSVPILRQKIPAKSFAALFISFAGVYIIASQGHPFTPGSSDPLGILLATGSSFFWALYFIFNMKDRRDESVKLFTNFFFASIYLFFALFIQGYWPLEATMKGISASLYVGVFEMGITFFFWLKALQLAETSDKVSNLVYLAPFLSMVLLYFIIKEPVYYTTPVGLILIISGIYVQNRKTLKGS